MQEKFILKFEIHTFNTFFLINTFTFTFTFTFALYVVKIMICSEKIFCRCYPATTDIKYLKIIVFASFFLWNFESLNFVIAKPA